MDHREGLPIGVQAQVLLMPIRIAAKPLCLGLSIIISMKIRYFSQNLLAGILLFTASSGSTLAQGDTSASQYGEFIGSVVVRWTEHDGPDREMVVMEHISFRDRDGKDWKVPEGAKINGASIPQFFWASVGPPFVGDYRRASVIHDYFCETMTEDWKDVHRMFYFAARTDGVTPIMAAIMYAAVRAGTRKWRRIETVGADGVSETRFVPFQPAISDDQFADIVNWIESQEQETNLDAIDALVGNYDSQLL